MSGSLVFDSRKEEEKGREREFNDGNGEEREGEKKETLRRKYDFSKFNFRGGELLVF